MSLCPEKSADDVMNELKLMIAARESHCAATHPAHEQQFLPYGARSQDLPISPVICVYGFCQKKFSPYAEETSRTLQLCPKFLPQSQTWLCNPFSVDRVHMAQQSGTHPSPLAKGEDHRGCVLAFRNRGDGVGHPLVLCETRDQYSYAKHESGRTYSRPFPGG
jgi:hypothetical protein